MPERTHFPPKASFGEAGFTLVEVLVASIILGLTVSAVSAMIINSSLLRSINEHNRQARVIAQEELEDLAHHFIRYPVGEMDAPINLDDGPGLVAVPANRTVTAGLHTVNILGVDVEYQSLDSKVAWSENGQNQNVTISKRITRVK
ncbi:MAG: hypothetical protein JWO30_3556 [Fibrobacteres bacterium]|nr:hypothetical protein [Fibrobacterota bacterium]